VTASPFTHNAFGLIDHLMRWLRRRSCCGRM